ncbi:hypothetical protein AOE01nite_01910 [Acetobacter oeni]|uniref:Uncharacterized protein n=1 Tax=Acetobacter oeni TaxID=304077 RepID=A0A511XG81_9PROT|nr:hypothetical protein AA21952_1320 [Acetobacter oeni LMG 21952]GEN61967.1 hypothetical protein AOE01nite_01910 [Acetobacter oeni]
MQDPPQIPDQFGKTPLPGAAAADQDQIKAFKTHVPLNHPQRLAKTAPCTVSRNRIAYFFCDSKSNPGRFIIVTTKSLQNQTGGWCLTGTRGNSQEL